MNHEQDDLVVAHFELQGFVMQAKVRNGWRDARPHALRHPGCYFRPDRGRPYPCFRETC